MHVVCVGDCGVDRYVSLGVDRAGGMTLNFAANARECFPSTDAITVVTALGSDEEARTVLAATRSRALECCVTRLEGRTPVQYIELEPNGEKRFVRYDEGVLGGYRPGARDQALIGDADLLVTNVYRQVREFFDALIAVPSRGLRFVDFLDLSDWDDGPAFVECYVDQFDIGQFGLAVRDDALIERLEALARRT